jgi:hypothetical protein
MFAAVIKVQEFHRTVPAILLQIPHPFGFIAQVQHLSGTPKPFTQSFPVEPPP